MFTIDLNSDVGESFGNWSFGGDSEIVSSVSSVNVACGFHAGDPSAIRKTCEAAASAGVAVGAHPAYRDLVGFGRRVMDISAIDLTNDVIYQIGAVQSLARAAGTTVRYVKPHGALYNTIGHHETQARAVVEAILAVDETLPLLVLPGTVIERVADAAGIRTVTEAFADRAYNPDGTLASRSQPGSVLHNVDEVVERVLRMTTERTIIAVDGSAIDINTESICVHGDTPGAVAMAAAIHQALIGASVQIASFA